MTTNHKVIVTTLGFAPARVLRHGLSRFYDTCDKYLPKTHYFLDQHYPMNREINRIEYQQLCKEYGLVYLDGGFDRGLHEGFNWLMSQAAPQAGDVVIGYDPDSGPIQSGWDRALVDTVRAGYSIVSLMDPRARIELAERGFFAGFTPQGRLVWEPRSPCCAGVTAFSGEFIQRVGPFKEENPFYGGLEIFLWDRQGRRWGYLPEFDEECSGRNLADPEYTAWKWEHAHFKSFKGSFQEFLRAGCPVTNKRTKAP